MLVTGIYETLSSLQASAPAGAGMSAALEAQLAAAAAGARGDSPPDGAAAPTSTIQLNPLLGVAPLGPQPLSKEHCYQHAMLDAAYHHLPHPSDSDRLRWGRGRGREGGEGGRGGGVALNMPKQVIANRVV